MARLDQVAVVAAAMMVTACASPMSLRGARVLEPGEVEVLASLQGQAGLADDGAGALYDVATVHPEVSVRFGLVDRVDLQLRVDPTVLPEVSAGYQVLGDPQRDDDVALTLTGGLKVGVEYYGTTYTYAAVPLQVLVDVPLSDELAFTGGARVNLLAFAPESKPSGIFTPARSAEPFGIAPGVVAGLRWKRGALVLQPELGVATGIGGYGAGAVGPARSLVVASLGLNVGGQFDFAAPAPRPPRPSTPASLH